MRHLSAKLGAATGRSLPELCRERYPRPVVHLLWAQAEIMAMATDLAETIGGAIALDLLFGIPLLAGALITAAVGVLLLGLRPQGRRHLATGFAVMLLGLVVAFALQSAQVGVTVADVAAGLLPGLAADGADGVDPQAVLLATGIVGGGVHVPGTARSPTGSRAPSRRCRGTGAPRRSSPAPCSRRARLGVHRGARRRRDHERVPAPPGAGRRARAVTVVLALVVLTLP